MVLSLMGELVGLLKFQFARLKDAQLPSVVVKYSNGLCVLRKGRCTTSEVHFCVQSRFQCRNLGTTTELTRGLDISAREQVLIQRHSWADSTVIAGHHPLIDYQTVLPRCIHLHQTTWK